jgi:hypothetical protein
LVTASEKTATGIDDCRRASTHIQASAGGAAPAPFRYGGKDSLRNRPLADKHAYRGIEFGVDEVGQGEWEWAYFPKAGTGVADRGRDGDGRLQGGDRQMARAARK